MCSIVCWKEVVQEWRKVFKETCLKLVRIWTKKNGVEIDCLVSRRRLLTKNFENWHRTNQVLKEKAERTGLRISFEKTDINRYVKHKNNITQSNTKYGTINHVDRFKYRVRDNRNICYHSVVVNCD